MKRLATNLGESTGTKASSTQDFVKKQHTSPKITVFDGKTNNAPRNGVKFNKFKSVSQGSEISPVDLEWSVIKDDNADVNNAASMEDRWERAIDLKTNRPYYFNTRTGKGVGQNLVPTLAAKVQMKNKRVLMELKRMGVKAAGLGLYGEARRIKVWILSSKSTI